MPNYAENKQAEAAVNEVGLDEEQARVFHDAITGQHISSYQELIEIAQKVADGDLH